MEHDEVMAARESTCWERGEEFVQQQEGRRETRYRVSQGKPTLELGGGCETDGDTVREAIGTRGLSIASSLDLDRL